MSFVEWLHTTVRAGRVYFAELDGNADSQRLPEFALPRLRPNLQEILPASAFRSSRTIGLELAFFSSRTRFSSRSIFLDFAALLSPRFLPPSRQHRTLILPPCALRFAPQ